MQVSVIIPLFNKAPYVARALSSVLAQTFTDFEVIVVDDGSTDGSARVVEQFSDHRLRLIKQDNSGPGAARNRGLAEAQGEFVAFLDADDCWLPAYLESGMRRFAAMGPKVAAVSSGYLFFPPGTSTEPLWVRRGLTEGIHRVRPDTPALFVVHLLAYLLPCTTIARTAVVRRCGGFFADNRCVYGEDSFLWLKVLLNESVAVDLRPLVEIHSEASALSTNRKSRPIEPLLTHSEQLHAACPEELRSLLDEVLALRAMKTAAVLGYWGQWQQGRRLLRRFLVGRSPKLAHLAAAHFCASPLGAGIGSTLRLFSRIRRGRPVVATTP
jgi:hypothetical protein